MSTRMSHGLDAVNNLSEQDFRDVMQACCASASYVIGMAKQRPFANEDALFEASRTVWKGLSTDDWLEAYAAHPRIGAVKPRESANRFENWSKGEQAGVSDAEQSVLTHLETMNEAYYNKHGFVFLICATGKSAAEMAEKLHERLQNETAKEIFEAADEQLQITEIRLRKALAEATTS